MTETFDCKNFRQPLIVAGSALTALLLVVAPAQAQFFDLFGGSRQVENKDDVTGSLGHAAQARKRHFRLSKTAGNIAREIPKEPVPHGPLQIVVSIATQSVAVYADGVPVAQAPISTGMPGHPTPMGVFSIIGKDKWHKSNIYSGAPMPYMERITWSGVALHEGVLPGHPASHGCIRLPASFAIKLWGMTRLGARVIVTRDPVAPVAFAHPRLFVPSKPVEKPDSPVATLPMSGQMERVASAEIVPVMKVAASATDSGGAPASSVDIAKPEPGANIPPIDAAPKRKGPVQAFISRKLGKLFVRQGMAPLFEAPVTITDPERPIGTHVYTAMEPAPGGDTMVWNEITIPSSYQHKAQPAARQGKKGGREDQAAAPVEGPSAAQALDRIELPKDAIERISSLLAPGSSLIVSDNALSDETGLDTDLIVLTR